MLEKLSTLFDHLHIDQWRDGLEILFLATIFYKISVWLYQERTRNLLIFFYLYYASIITCKVVDLPILSFLLFAGAPIVAMLAITFHQETLQRNFVMYRKRILLSEQNQYDWLELMMRNALHALNSGQDWHILIEHTHDLSSLLATCHVLEAQASESLFSIITTSSLYKPNELIWIKSKGSVHAINTRIIKTQDLLWYDQAIQNFPEWKQHALAITLKTDAIICKALPEWRAFDVIIAGKVFEQISAQQVLKLLSKHLNYTYAQGDMIYEKRSHPTSYHKNTP